LSTCFTIRHGKRLGKTLKFPRLSCLGSFKVSASVSEAATSRLGLGQNFERLGLRDGSRVSAQKVSCTSLKGT